MEGRDRGGYVCMYVYRIYDAPYVASDCVYYRGMSFISGFDVDEIMQI